MSLGSGTLAGCKLALLETKRCVDYERKDELAVGKHAGQFLLHNLELGDRLTKLLAF